MTHTLFSKLFLTLSLAALLAPSGTGQSAFTTQDVRGTYAFTFEGSLTRVTTGQAIPVTAVGVFTLDGQGKVTKGARYLNVGGQVVRETASGTYTVNADGTGTASFTVIPVEGEAPVVPPTLETFNFVFKSGRAGWGIGSTIRAANGQDIGLVIGVKTEFVRQDVP